MYTSSLLPTQLNPRPSKSFNAHVREFDFLGLLLAVGGVVCILLGFNFSETSWSDAKTIGLLVAGVVLLALCAINESLLTTRNPIFPPRMFKTITTTGLLLSTFVQSISFTGYVVVSRFIHVTFDESDGLSGRLTGARTISPTISRFVSWANESQ
jgi:drug/metabolite transporter (DMT)-like permease